MSFAAVPRKVNVIGLPVAGVAIPDVLRVLDGWIGDGERSYVTVTGAHGIVECLHDNDLAAIHHEAGMIVPDGMPVVWMARARGAKETQRCYGPDLMLATLTHSIEKGYSHYFYGGGEGTVELLIARLQGLFPAMKVAGSYTPPFRSLTSTEADSVVAAINDSGADIVWVGLSTPKQERWMAEYRPRLKATVLVGVGAAFDFHAGLKPQAPKFMQRNGLEWLYRLGTEPRRLWRRYAVVIPTFLVQAGLQLSGLKQFEKSAH